MSGVRYGLPGEPKDFRKNPLRTEIGLDRGVRWATDGRQWGIAVKEATARKYLSPNARALAERRGSNLFWPYLSKAAIVFYEMPQWAKETRNYAKVDLPPTSQFESIIRSKHPEYFEKEFKELPKLRKGDRIRTTEPIGKGLGSNVTMEVTRVTPSTIWTDNGYRIPQALYHDGLVVKVGSSLVTKVADRYLSQL